MKIAILGGTFDPMTQAHLAMAEKVIEEKIADKVIIVPTIVTYHKPCGNKPWLDYADRCFVIREMILSSYCREYIELDCTDFDAIGRVSPCDRKAFQSSRRFIHTLLDIKAKYSADTKFFFIIGTDQAEKFSTWFQYKDILRIATPIVFNGREGSMLNLNRIFADYEFIELTLDLSKYGYVSSTKIRECMKGQTASYYIEHIGERIIARTPIFDLVEKSIVQPGFRPIGINSKDWVSVFVERDGKVLCVKQLRYGTMQECEELPCGMIEDGEVPKCAAMRELLEETGYNIPDWRDVVYLGKYAANPAFMNNYMHYFYVNLDKVTYDYEEPNPDEHEKLQVYWKDRKQFVEDFEKSCGSAIMAAMLYKIVRHDDLIAK